MDKLEACHRIARHLQPGTVIVSYPSHTWYDYANPLKWPGMIAQWQIQSYQKDYFGPAADYRPTHVLVYLGSLHGDHPGFDIKGKSFFEFTLPTSRFTSLWDICENDLAVVRPAFPVSQADAEYMRMQARQLEGLKYDIGDLLDFLLTRIIGYPAATIKVFDQGTKRMVCSTVVASLYASLRKRLEIEGESHVPRLFDIVDFEFWRKRGVIGNIEKLLPETTGRVRTPVERVTPAHYVNTRYFQREFDTVKRFKKGVACQS